MYTNNLAMAPVRKIKKRNGEIVDFSPQKITIAIQKSFAAVLGESHEQDAIDITRTVMKVLDDQFANTAFIPSVESVQDLVENAIATHGYFTVSKAYIVYRYEHAKQREEKRAEVAEKITEQTLFIEKRDGGREHFSESKLTRTLLWAAQGYERDIDVPAIIARVRAEMYDGIKTTEIHEVLVMVVRSMIERDPTRSNIAAKLLLQAIYREIMGEVDYKKLDGASRNAFLTTIKRGVQIGQFDPKLLEFDLEALADPPQPGRRPPF